MSTRVVPGRFEVKLEYGKTTFVSYRKLVAEEAAKLKPKPQRPETTASNDIGQERNPEEITAEEGAPSPALITPPVAKPLEKNADALGGLPIPKNRFGSVIENIERLYMGLENDDETTLDNPPTSGMQEDAAEDEDGSKGEGEDEASSEYDTEDSFIDDSELNTYFTTEGKRKHGGFFVNKGDLEKEEVNVAAIPKLRGPKKQGAAAKTMKLKTKLMKRANLVKGKSLYRKLAKKGKKQEGSGVVEQHTRESARPAGMD